jgi:hypothetical protein
MIVVNKLLRMVFTNYNIVLEVNSEGKMYLRLNLSIFDLICCFSFFPFPFHSVFSFLFFVHNFFSYICLIPCFVKLLLSLRSDEIAFPLSFIEF